MSGIWQDGWNPLESFLEILPAFIMQMIILSGILHWNYQIQIFTGE